jgi:hypothetical protein
MRMLLTNMIYEDNSDLGDNTKSTNDQMKNNNSIFSKVLGFYYDGFRNMSGWGRKVWLIILIKLFIMFAILRLFFFPDFLKQKYDNDKQRSEYVLDQLINSR